MSRDEELNVETKDDDGISVVLRDLLFSDDSALSVPECQPLIDIPIASFMSFKNEKTAWTKETDNLNERVEKLECDVAIFRDRLNRFYDWAVVIQAEFRKLQSRMDVYDQKPDDIDSTLSKRLGEIRSFQG
jgi:alpha-acetolactate decarboxylase